MKDELKSLYEIQNNLIDQNNSLSFSNLKNLNLTINNSRSISINNINVNENNNIQLNSISECVRNNINQKEKNNKTFDQPDDYCNNYLPTNDSHIKQNYNNEGK